MAPVWDVYLDADDAATLLHAARTSIRSGVRLVQEGASRRLPRFSGIELLEFQPHSYDVDRYPWDGSPRCHGGSHRDELEG